jgi:hypothetical protein
LGFVPDHLTAIPQPELLSLCDELEANPLTSSMRGSGQ